MLCSESCAKRHPASAQRIAMHDADARVADFRDQMHRQRGQSFAQPGLQGVGAPRGIAQALENRVRAFYVGVGHRLRISAAAAIGGIVAGELGFNVAAERDVSRHGVVDMHESIVVRVEPVKIAVENNLRSSCLALGHALDLGQREAIAVQPADDVQHFGAQLGSARKR